MVEIPTNKIHYNGPFITGTSGASPHHIPIILRLMAEGKLDATKYITHISSLHMLERILTVKGIPAFESLDDVISSRGREFFDFLYKEELGINEYPTLREKVKAFKDSILKALVVPNLSDEEGIIPLSEMSIDERRRFLNNLIK